MGTSLRAAVRRSFARPILAAIAAAYLMPAAADGQTTATWNGTTGNWTDAARWSTNPNFPNDGTPTATTYNAAIGSGAVTIDQNITVTGLTLTGGSLTGGSDLAVTNLNLAGGTLGGTGSLTVGTLTVSGSTTVNRSITLAGSGNAINSGCTLGAGVTWSNGSGVTTTFRNGVLAGAGTFDNAGTLVVSGVGFTSQLLLPFNNKAGGLVDVQDGTLRAWGGGTQAGAFNVGANTYLVFGGTHNIEAGTTFSGLGSVTLYSGTFNVNAPVSIPTLELEAATLAGSASLTLGAFKVRPGGGVIARSVTFGAGPANLVDGNATLNAGCVLTNPAGATVSFRNGVLAGAGTFDNAGSIVVSGVGFTSQLLLPFNNKPGATIDIQDGTLRIWGGGTQTGTFKIGANTYLVFAGLQNIETGTTFSGLGRVTLYSGTFSVNAPVSIPILELEAATLAGSGFLTVGALAIRPGGGVIARSVAFGAGPANLVDGNATLNAGCTLTNPAGAAVAFRNGVLAGAGTFENSGTLTVSGVGFTSQLLLPFNNKAGGSVDVQDGTLRVWGGGTHAGPFKAAWNTVLDFRGGHTFNAGTSFAVESGGTLAFSGPLAFNASTSVSGLGDVSIAAGSQTLNADVSFVNLAVAGGNLSGAGTLTAAGLRLSGTTTSPVEVVVTGTAGIGLTGAANLRNLGSLTLSPGAGAVSSVFQASGSGGVVTNGGTLAAGSGTVTVAVNLSNGSGGTLTAGPGAVLAVDNAARSFSDLGGPVAPAGGTVSFSSGSLALPSGTLGGFGSVPAAVNAGRAVSPTGTLSVASLALGAGSAFSPRIAGTGAGQAGNVAAGGDVSLAGTLSPDVTPAAAASLSAADAIPVASAGGTLSGSFANVTDGGRVADSAGYGSFVVRCGPGSPFGAGNVVLTGWRTSVVQLAAAGYVVDKGAGAAVIAVTRSGGLNSAVSVSYAATAGTAVAGVDFAPVSGTLAFAPGETLKTFAVPVLDNPAAVADVTVNIGLVPPAAPAVAGSPATAVLTVRNAGGTPSAFRFALSAYSTGKNQGPAVIEVRRLGDTAAAGSVAWGTSPLTAVAGADYAPASGTLVFGPGESSRSFAVPLLENPVPPGDVTLALSLSDPSAGSALAAPSAATLTIADTGGTYSRFAFSAAAYSADKDAGDVPVTVVRTGRLDFPASVAFSAAPGSATAADFVPVSGTLSFAPGETQRTFLVRTLNNAYAAGDVAVSLTLGPASRAAGLSSPSAAALTVRNATAFGPALPPIPRYRLFLPAAGIHLFTADPNEYATLPLSGWVPEGVAHRVFPGPRTGAPVEAVAMWRLFDRTRRDHFWTTDAVEYAFLRSLPSLFDDEGVDSYVYPSQVAGTVPLLRLRFGDGSRHLWTTDANEYAVLAGLGWVQEGLVGFVLP